MPRAATAATKYSDAVDLTMHGWILLWHGRTREVDRAAHDSFEQAVKLDPTNTEAYGGIAYSRTRDLANGWAKPGTNQAAFMTHARQIGHLQWIPATA